MMNFFVTGNELFKAGIDLKFIASTKSYGANFSFAGQTLSESLSIAQEIFGRVKRGKIDFVLIGLAPDVLFQGGDKISAEVFDKNLNTLSEYLKLCIDNGAKPVCMILPVAPSVRESCRKKFVEPLRSVLAELKKIYDFEFVDLFDLPLPKNYLADESLSSDGTIAVSTILTFELYARKIFSFKDFCRMNYAYFFELSRCLSAKLFHKLMEKIFQSAISELKRKDKIKVAFVTDHAATWCGDELYNFFADNPHFEPTIFLCLAKVDGSVATMAKEIACGVEKFKARGLNVIGIFNEETETPPQDLLIFLRPYEDFFPKTLRFNALTFPTLATYIHYCYETSGVDYYNYPIFRLAWKSFFDGELTRKIFDAKCRIGMPRAYASGLPKMDSFFESVNKFYFPWKMTRPDTKKIIWAPHWSIFAKENPGFYGTFHHNFRFMYEFAKTHPEISWVLKPHPLLPRFVLETRLFSSAEAFEDYIQAWNDLPNAQVFTGAYYQEIFATSDGMIHDSGSFLAEYQYTHKPMIYLTRKDPTAFTEMGEKILEASYCVDGRDLDGIAVLLQKVFIEGNDPLKAARQKVFDELLNYRRVNGMSATEFIFHGIADELTGEQ